MAENIRLGLDVFVNQSSLTEATRNITSRARQLDRAFNRLNPRGLTQIQRTLRETGSDLTRIERTAEAATGAFGDLGRVAGLTAKRFIVYRVISSTLLALVGAARTAVTEFLKFDAALNRAEQIINPLINDVGELRSGVFDLATAYGVAIGQVQDATETFLRQGNTVNETLKLTSASLGLVTAAGVDAAQATEALTSIIRQFNKTAEESIKITDSLVAVSINYAVTAQDLDLAIRRSGSAAQTVGVQFEELIGFITAAQEATRRGGQVIGTGLRTIFTRIFRAPAIEALQQLGIETRTAAGEFRPASQLIGELAARFTDLSRTQQIAIASTISGQRQVATLLALLRNYDRAVQATNDAVEAQGTTAELTRKRQEALEVSIQKLANEFTRLGVSLAEIAKSPVATFFELVGSTVKGLANIFEGTDGSISILGVTLLKTGTLLAAQALGAGKVNDAYLRMRSGAKKAADEQERVNQSLLRARRAVSDRAANTRGRIGQTTFGLGRQNIDPAVQAETAARREAQRVQETQRQLTDLQITQSNQLLGIEQEQANIKRNENTIQTEFVNLKKAELAVQKEIFTFTQQINQINRRRQSIQLSEGARRIEVEKIASLEENINQLKSREARVAAGTDAQRRKRAQEVLILENKIANLKKQESAARGPRGGATTRSADIRAERERAIASLAEKTNALREIGGEKELRRQREILSLESQRQQLIDRRSARQGQLANLDSDELKLREKSEANINAITKDQARSERAVLTASNAIETSTKNIESISRQNARTKRQSIRLQAQLNAQVNRQKELEKTAATEAQRSQQRLLSSRGNIGLAIGASIGLGALANEFEELGDKGDETARRLGVGFKEAGGVISTALLTAGTGPLGVFITLASLTIAITKTIKSFGLAAGDAFQTAQDSSERYGQSLRGISTTFTNAEVQAQKFLNTGQSLDIDGIEKFNKDFDSLAESIDGSAGELGIFREKLLEAVQEGDIKRVRALREELQRFRTLQAIGTGDLLNVDNIRDSINIAQSARENIAAAKEELRDTTGTDALGFGFAQIALQNAKIEENEKILKEANDAIKVYGNTAVRAFGEAVDGSLSLQENLDILGEGTREILQETGRLDTAFRKLAQAQDFAASTSFADSIANLNAEERALTEQVQAEFAARGSAISSLDNILESFNETQGRGVEVALKLNRQFADTEGFDRFVKALAAAKNVSEDTIRRTLLRNINDANRGFRVFRLETGEVGVQFDKTGEVISIANRKWSEINATIAGNSRILGVNIQQQDKQRAVLIDNNAVLDTFDLRLRAVNSILTRSTSRLSEFTDAVSKLEGSQDVVAQAFPRQSLEASTDAITALIGRGGQMGTLAEVLRGAFERLDIAADDLRLTIANNVSDSIDRGGDAIGLYTARVEAAKTALSAFRVEGRVIRETLENISDVAARGGISFGDSEIARLARQRLEVENVGNALLGLASIRDRLQAGQDGSFVLNRDVQEVQKFGKVISDALGIDPEDVPQLTTGASGRQRAIAQLKNFLSVVSKEAVNQSSAETKDIFTQFGRAINENFQSEISQSGDAPLRPLSSILLDDLREFREKSKPLVEAAVQSYVTLANQGTKAIETAIGLAENRLDQFQTVVAQGTFVPDFSDSGAARRNIIQLFSDIRQGTDIEVAKLQARADNIGAALEGLRFQQKQLTDASTGRAIQGQQDAFARTQREINDLLNERETLEVRINAARQSAEDLPGRFINLVAASIQQVGRAQQELFKQQDALIKNEVALTRQRLAFSGEELSTYDQKVALARAERAEVEKTLNAITGLDNVSLESLKSELLNLTDELVSAQRSGASAARTAAIQTEIAERRRVIDLIQEAGQLRLTTLNREIELINEQQDAVRNLANEFLRAGDTQQRQIIESSRLLDNFFGGITEAGLETPQFTKALSDFLSQATDQQRQGVLEQLERVRGVGGEVAPGVSAEDVLFKIQDALGAALFKSPQVRLAEEQKQLQKSILDVMIDNNRISEVQAEIAARSVTAFTKLNSDLIKLGSSGDLGTDVQQETKKLQDSLNAGVNEISAINNARTRELRNVAQQTRDTTISNKDFVDTMREVDTSTSETGETLEEFRARQVALRDDLINAEDKLIDAQQGVVEALARVGDAAANSAAALADYTLGIELTERTNLSAIGSFSTYRQEIDFLNEAFNSQIRALQNVGSAEQQIADLRVRLAQETLGVLEAQIGQLRSNAENLLTAQSGAEFFNAAQAGEIAAGILNDIGIGRGERATTQQLGELSDRILSLPLEVRQALANIDELIPPGATFSGGFGGDEILTNVLAALGGTNDEIPDLLTLEEQAAEQRRLIAENSTQQLNSSRTQVATAFEQLAAAQEQVLEARAQRDLIQLQLEATRDGFSRIETVMQTVADNIAFRGFSQSGIGINAAGGTLSAGEVRGLLSAAGREKRAMPTGAQLGVFNTSETVLTRRQTSMLRKKTNIPNAVDGFGNTSPDNEAMLALLAEISRKLESVTRDDGVRTVNVEVGSRREVNVTGTAGLQTALQDIISDRTADLYSREEGQAIINVLQTLIDRLRVNGLSLPPNVERSI